MTIRKKIHSALTAAFPDIESITSFVENSNNRRKLQSFVELAARHQLIKSADSEAFKAFVLANHRPLSNGTADKLTMEELINNKSEHLNIHISNRALTEKINRLLSKNSVKLPPLSSTIFTRLKRQAANTPLKQDALRGFAFWIGYERGDMGREWHYKTLKDLCGEDTRKTVKSAAFGVRIAFSINSRSRVIGKDIIRWLKRTIKKILNQSPNIFFDGMPIKVKSYDLTTFFVDFPSMDAGAIHAVYGNTLKKAITIAYHLSIYWMISGFANYSRFCSIGIAAGEFSELNVQLQAALNASLPEDGFIRLTDYARQCIVTNEIRVVLNSVPKEVRLINNDTAKVWWIKELSNVLYWNLTPAMLNVGTLDEVKTPYLEFPLPLPSDPPKKVPPESDDPISYFMDYPHHSMLGFEIARVLFFRKRLTEAVEVLQLLLKITPGHISARIMLMMIYKIFAVEAPNYRLADLMFRRAEKEAQYIATNLKHGDEDFYHEYAALKLARLALGIKMLRKHPDGRVAKGFRLTAADLLALADAAEDVLMQGISLSRSVKRIDQLFISVHILKIVLMENIDGNGTFPGRLTCPKSIIKEYLLEIFFSAAKYQKFSLNMPDIDTVNQILTERIRRNENSVPLEIFKPTRHFNNAIIFWDLMPIRNVAFTLSTLKELKLAVKTAEAHALKEEYILSDITMDGQIVAARTFINQVNTVIEEIEKRYKKESELKNMNPARKIGSDTDDLVLMTYHI